MIKHEILVPKGHPIINGFSSLAVELSKIATLSHKVCYYSMEGGAFIT
jgi:hypothetical protein